MTKREQVLADLDRLFDQLGVVVYGVSLEELAQIFLERLLEEEEKRRQARELLH